jgi:hypothetical protein
MCCLCQYLPFCVASRYMHVCMQPLRNAHAVRVMAGPARAHHCTLFTLILLLVGLLSARGCCWWRAGLPPIQLPGLGCPARLPLCVPSSVEAWLPALACGGWHRPAAGTGTKQGWVAGGGGVQGSVGRCRRDGQDRRVRRVRQGTPGG